ncbi:MAG TPA: DUF4129 domain-containing protein [Vicinamibacterales bacterium]|nr:DUF4129 domain-containing protein [Vicinamibacterales bacterium]
MPSRLERGVRLAALVATLSAPPLAALAAQPASAASAPAPDPAEIPRAIEAVKTDPNLATERTIKALRWRDSSPSKPWRAPGWLSWISGLLAWVGESARVLVWVGAAGLAGLLVVYLTRVARTRLADPADGAFVVPTHVRDLDIRPETLPDDVGAAARQLWDRGEQRAALALLYRGMLSRLAHVHGVPIRESSTEGDCLALAAARLPDRAEYLSRLVRVWQRFGYGREPIDTTTVHALCDEFASALRPVSAGAAPAPEAA